MKILVVVDLQNDFVSGCLGNEECKAAADAAAKVIRDGGYNHVFVTKDTHFENYLNTQEGRNLPVVHCIRGSEGWELCPQVKAALENSYAKEAVTVLEKPTFGSQKLGEAMQTLCNEIGTEAGKNVTVDFVGVCTGICVISNVFVVKAFCPEAKLRVIEKACACVTKESHKTAIEAMKLCQTEIIGTIEA